ncbi:hypothetical protein [Reichenbachiella sp.]|uniref:hypothetical protein n=1 Tax=Reichenbachiella sp. TaxID=2184521 RepID=UPI003BAF0D9F
MPMIENSIQEHTQAESKKEQLLTKKEGQNTKSVSTPAWQEDSKSIALLSKKHSFELHQAVFNLDSYDVKIDIRQIQGGNWRLYFKFSTEKIFPSDILLSSPYPLYTISTASRHKAKMLSLSYKNLKIEEKFDIDEFYDNGAFNVKIGYSFNGEEIVFDIFYPDGELMESHSITSSKFNYFKMILIGVDENVRMIYSVEKIERTIVLPF